MALRIRKDGRVLCAAMHPAKPGDTYLHDGISEVLTGCTGEVAVLVTEPGEKHAIRGEWWWAGSVPDDVEIEALKRLL